MTTTEERKAAARQKLCSDFAELSLLQELTADASLQLLRYPSCHG